MPRIARGLRDGSFFHVINRGNGRQDVFHKNQDYEAFIELIKEAKARFPVQLFAYCLMPNHFHLLLVPRQADDLSRWMQWLMTSHVRRYHQHYKTTGHVWQGRFKSFLIQDDIHFLAVLRYIEGNPVRARLVDSALDWKWSSHGETTDRRPCLVVDKLPIELPGNWSCYVDDSFEEQDLERLRQSVNRGAPYGTTEWQGLVSQELGLESTIRKKGRPRKE